MNAPHKPKKKSDGGGETRSRKTGLTTLKGILLPVDWDDKGCITAVALSTADEKEYLVVKDKKGKQLLPLVREELELTGVIRTIRNANTITVVDYRTKTGWEPV